MVPTHPVEPAVPFNTVGDQSWLTVDARFEAASINTAPAVGAPNRPNARDSPPAAVLARFGVTLQKTMNTNLGTATVQVAHDGHSTPHGSESCRAEPPNPCLLMSGKDTERTRDTERLNHQSMVARPLREPLRGRLAGDTLQLAPGSASGGRNTNMIRLAVPRGARRPRAHFQGAA